MVWYHDGVAGADLRYEGPLGNLGDVRMYSTKKAVAAIYIKV
jgi:hypothetical protein